MVSGGSAVVEDSGLVVAPVGGIDGDTGGLSLDVGLEGWASVSLEDLSDLVGSGVDGALGLSLEDSRDVWVLSLSNDTVVLDIGEGLPGQSSVASAVLLGAIDELLLRKAWQFVVVQEPVSLSNSGGSEGPA